MRQKESLVKSEKNVRSNAQLSETLALKECDLCYLLLIHN